jgi:pilus assembly protein CpaC
MREPSAVVGGAFAASRRCAVVTLLLLASCSRSMQPERPPRPPAPNVVAPAAGTPTQAAAVEEAREAARAGAQRSAELENADALTYAPYEPARLSSAEPTIVIQAGKSRLVQLGRPMTRVSVGDPEVAELVLVSPTEVLVNGRKVGDTSLILWDQRGVSEVHTLSIQESSDRQVVVDITIAELNRTAMEEHGVDYRVLRTDLGLVFQPGKIAPLTGFFPPEISKPPLQMQTGDNVTFGIVHPDSGVAAFFEFIQREGLGKILAEPHLVARSGREAKFLSGGEIPIVVAEALQTSVTFKEFGTRLRFKPTVRDDDTIDLEVAPEVSEPDFNNGVNLFGFRVPAFVTRRADTRVTLRDGESLVIAGLFRENRVEEEQKVPYLGDIPGLGYLFRRTTYTRNKNELMIIVRPHLADVIPPGAPVPIYDRGPLRRSEVRSQATDAGVSRPRITATLPPSDVGVQHPVGPDGQRHVQSYSVQVSATHDRAAADALVAALSARGYVAYMLAIPQDGGTVLYQVRVGMYASVDEASAEAARLRREPGVTDVLVVAD